MNGTSEKKKRNRLIGLIILLAILVIGVSAAMIAKTMTATDNQADDQIEAEAGTSRQAETVAEEPADWMTEGDFRLSSHRGCTSSVPENTLEGIRKVSELGFGAVEIDPRLSGDRTFFIMHDDSVSGTTDGYGHISSMSDEQIKSLNISTSSYPDYAGKTVKVPTFEEAVELISQTGMVLNVDGSKGAFDSETGAELIVSILDKYDMYGRSFAVISDPAVRERVHEAYPDLCLSWLYDDSTSIEANIEEVKRYPRAMLSMKEELLSDSMLKTLLDSGIYFQVYNVNRGKTCDRLKAAGVPMIETDALTP